MKNKRQHLKGGLQKKIAKKLCIDMGEGVYEKQEF